MKVPIKDKGKIVAFLKLRKQLKTEEESIWEMEPGTWPCHHSVRRIASPKNYFLITQLQYNGKL